MATNNLQKSWKSMITLTFVSDDPVAMKLLYGWNDRLLMLDRCPINVISTASQNQQNT